MGVVNDKLSFRGALTRERLGDEWLRFYAADVSADNRGRAVARSMLLHTVTGGPMFR